MSFHWNRSKFSSLKVIEKQQQKVSEDCVALAGRRRRRRRRRCCLARGESTVELWRRAICPDAQIFLECSFNPSEKPSNDWIDMYREKAHVL